MFKVRIHNDHHFAGMGGHLAEFPPNGKHLSTNWSYNFN